MKSIGLKTKKELFWHIVTLTQLKKEQRDRSSVGPYSKINVSKQDDLGKFICPKYMCIYLSIGNFYTHVDLETLIF